MYNKYISAIFSFLPIPGSPENCILYSVFCLFLNMVDSI